MEFIQYLKEKFQTPGTENRSQPFWAWNDKLREDELKLQLVEMKTKGMGGVVIHSREGLETKYLGHDWMNLVESTVKSAKDSDMFVWIYDEDKWPSGSAGGLVALNNDKYAARAMTMEIADNFSGNESNIIAIFKISLNNDKIVGSTKLDTSCDYKCKYDESLLIFRCEISGNSEWYNGSAPSDNLSPEAVARFINITHNKYKEKVGTEFGSTIKGFFTDEPNVADFFSVFHEARPWLPWTDGILDYFKSQRGYNLVDFLPYLFFSGHDSFKIRHDYWRTITERFSESYSKQLGEWCEKNNLLLAGHYLFENDLGYATRVSGSNMPQYRYLQVPSIDILGEQTLEYLTVKQCSSVAHQYGRKWVMSETYGCTGWDFTFEGLKWLTDWQYVMGINLRCQHLSLYTLKGLRKRDYPPSFNYNNCWWKYNIIIEDYYARLGAILTEGEVVRDLLVLHPASTFWGLSGSSPVEDLKKMDPRMGWLEPNIVELNKLGDEYGRVIESLLGFHYDLDIGDEIIINEKGKVCSGKLCVNLASYKAVIIPSMQTMLESTFKLLLEFMDAGGTVISIKPVPTKIEGTDFAGLEILFEHDKMIMVDAPRQLFRSLEDALPRNISIKNKKMTEDDDVYYMFREKDNVSTLFVVNNDRNNRHEVLIEVLATGRVEEWDLLTGKLSQLGVETDGPVSKFVVTIGKAGSKLFVIDKNEKSMQKKAEFSYKHPHKSIDVLTSLGPKANFTRTMPNAVVMDKCCYRIKADTWSEEMDVWKAQMQIRESLDMRKISSSGVVQRYKWVNEPHENDETFVEFKFDFSIIDLPEKDMYIVVENAKNFEISCNGAKLENEIVGWYIDRSFHKIKLIGQRKGVNEVILSCKYLNKMEMEDCYIIGDFGVDTNRNITTEPKTLYLSDWCMQGYFHYSGSMVYHFNINYNYKNGKRMIFKIGKYCGVNVEIRVNNFTAGYIPWDIVEGLDITDFLDHGENTIDIEVMGSSRNLFGPFHNVFTGNTRTEPKDFRTQDSQYTPDYLIVPYGLMGQVDIFEEEN